MDSLSVFHLSFGVGHEAYIGPAKGIEMSTGNFDGNAKSAIFGKRIIKFDFRRPPAYIPEVSIGSALSTDEAETPIKMKTAFHEQSPQMAIHHPDTMSTPG